MARLTLSDISVLEKANEEKVQEIRFLGNGNKRDSKLCLRQERTLSGYKYNETNRKWALIWKKQTYENEAEYPLEKFPWSVSDAVKPGEDIILIHHPDGVRFYKINWISGTLELVKKDGNFHEVNNYKLCVGNIYPDADWIGVMARDPAGDTKFFAATADSFLPTEPDPLFSINTNNADLTSTWNSAEEIFFASIRRKLPSAIGVRTKNEIVFYQFNSDYLLEMLTKVVNIPICRSCKSDKLLYTSRNAQMYRDILHLNDTGLYVYNYKEQPKEYRFVQLIREFTKVRGWSPHFTDSVIAADIDNDGNDDILYTGADGLTGLSYDSTTYNRILHPEDLKSFRYSTIISTLPPMLPYTTNPSIFVQNSDGEITWNEIIREYVTPTPPLLDGDPITTPLSISSDPISPLLETSRLGPNEKPILRWEEQFHAGVLKRSADARTGAAQLYIPLTDLQATTGWKLDVSLHYNSKATTSGVVGAGWSVPIAELQDYIYVDSQGSIYPDDMQYYLVAQGQRFPLTYLSESNHVAHYKIEDQKDSSNDILIDYDMSQQKWVAIGPQEEVVYGKDAVQRGLEWPYWRGPGLDAYALQPTITAWYIKSRINKFNNHSLNYEYRTMVTDISNKKYVSDVYLETITDNHNFKIAFQYARKNNAEIIDRNPLNNKNLLVFPANLKQEEFLKKCTILTDTYTQSFEFLYRTEQQNRFLIAVSQNPKEGDHLMQFEYQELLDHSVVSKCKVLSVSLSFSYDTIQLTGKERPLSSFRYKTEGTPKIAQGSDYVAAAYKSGKQIVLQLLNKEMSRVIADCHGELVCPSLRSDIDDFTLHSYENMIILFIASQQKFLYVYERRNEKWVKEPTTLSFDKNDLIQYNSQIIANFSANNILNLHVFNKKNNNWSKSTHHVKQRVRKLAVSKRTVVCFDGYNLLLFYVDKNLQWHSKILDQNLHSMASENEKILSKFNLSSEDSSKLFNFFDQFSLQTVNNFITLGSLQLNGHLLSYNIRMYLLDSKYELAKLFTHNIGEENILQKTFLQSKDGNTYKLGYVYENNKYMVQVLSVWGQIDEQINKIRNKNLRQDERDRTMKNIRDSSKDALKNACLVNWNRYIGQIGSEGVYFGGEVLLRITGNSWKEESISKTIPLSKHMKLEKSENTLNLYNRKTNKIEKSMSLDSSGLFSNNYPSYFAYQENKDSIKVILLEHGESVVKDLKFQNEQLLLSSNAQNLITKTANEYIVRPLQFLATIDFTFVNHTRMSGGDDVRELGFQHSFNSNVDDLSYSETSAIIPGNSKSQFGWQEVTITHHNNDTTTTKERWFDGDGKGLTNVPAKQQTGDQNNSSNETGNHPGLLLDKSGNWIISNFSPYNLKDEMVGFYGFETYETDEIGVSYSDRTNINKRWHFQNGKVVSKRFALTGENYLQLEEHGLFEGLFRPTDQDNTTFVASSWIRCDSYAATDMAVPYLKAIIQTPEGEEVVGLLGKIKRIKGKWIYVEVIIDFSLIRDIYKKYINYKEKSYSPNDKLQVLLRIEATDGDISVDHIRFSPLTFDFEAEVFNPVSGNTIATINEDGSINRKIYDHVHREIASINGKDQVEAFSTNNRNGQKIEFKPERGIYEYFDEQSLQTNWVIEHSAKWRVAPGQLIHNGSQFHKIQASPYLFSAGNAAIRFMYALLQDQSNIVLEWSQYAKVQLTRNSTLSFLKINEKSVEIPSAGEIIVTRIEKYIWIWTNGKLIMDERVAEDSATPWSSFEIKFQGEVFIADVFILNNPAVTVNCFNAFGEKSQTLKLESTQTALVKETLYDEVGRESIVTKTTRIRRSDPRQPLLTYRPQFVENAHRDHGESVWEMGRLIGEVSTLNPSDQGFPYMRSIFAPNPLDEKVATGLPGKEFSVDGKYSTKIISGTDISFVHNMFPTRKGYYYKVEHTPRGSKKVSIFDKFENEVARYVRVPGFEHLFSTYEYDNLNRLIQILPPEFHQRANTFGKLTSWDIQKQHFSREEQGLVEALSSRFSYDSNGKLISKFSPDSGTIKYIYNQNGQMRFMVTVNSDNHPNIITYFEYNEFGEYTRTGHLNNTISLEKLEQFKNNITSLPYTQDYQVFSYSNDHLDPTLRNRIRYYTTYNEDETVIEKLEFDDNENIISRDIEAANIPSNVDSLTSFDKVYRGDRLHTLAYPSTLNGKPFHLLHSYNQLGQLISLGTRENPSQFAAFSYYASGHLESEHVQREENFGFRRTYNYNSPGFLEEISDPYITEFIDYTRNGYGQNGYGDGMIMQTSYNATWIPNADARWFQVREDDLTGNNAKMCFAALTRLGYLNSNNQPTKLFLEAVETSMPPECGGKTGKLIEKLLAERQPTIFYGHRYAYGNHQELTKAKYFTMDSSQHIDPLQPDSFAKNIPGVTIEQSQHIWKLLTKTYYIIPDQKQIDINTAIGKNGKSILNDERLLNDLKSLNERYIVYYLPIKKLVLNHFGEQNVVTRQFFEKTFLKWNNLDNTSSMATISWTNSIAKKISDMLFAKGYFDSHMAILDDDFKTSLHQYEPLIPKIVQVLVKKFAYALGNAAYDVESYDIDANGNHRLFYVGFNRFQLNYQNLTNKVQSVKVNWFTGDKAEFPMGHDTRGNVIQALHKNIKNISYHPVSQRPTRIALTDGRKVHLFYGSRGERLLKRVINAEGKLTYEKFYLHDDKGRVLVDQVIKYDIANEPETTTSTYIYGPRGLCGFVRNNVYHAVVADHAGSVRLVLKSGRVVAAYDYLPYGELMRSYGYESQSHLDYRYTGQEFDEETGLYNFHARLYDPSIGRFYQPDPKGQYFSPYKFSGNSPISVVDPDGEFAFLIACIIGAVIGAYLGGAAANNRWNIAKWDFKDPGTYLGMVGGALAGGFMPVGFAGSAVFFAGVTGSAAAGIGITTTLGLGGMYLMGSAVNGDLDPTKWAWDRPGTWNGLFQGFGVGSGLVGGIHHTHVFAAKFGNTGRIVFLTAAYGTGLTVGYFSGVLASDGNFKFWEWDPSFTLIAFIDGFGGGVGLTQGLAEIGRGAAKLRFKVSALKLESKRLMLKKILQNSKHPLYKAATVVVMTYYMGTAASGEIDITKWNLHSFSTYEGILNGVFMGKDMGHMTRRVRRNKIKMKDTLAQIPKKVKQNWQEKVIKVIYKMLAIKNTEFSKIADRNVRPWVRRKLPLKVKAKLLKWKNKIFELSIKKREIFLDKEEKFLSCGSHSRRKKRAPGDFICYVPGSKNDETMQEPEIVQTLFDVENDPGLKSSFEIIPPGENGFSENLSQLLQDTPVWGAVTSPDFLQNLVLGSVLTLTKTTLPGNEFFTTFKTVSLKSTKSQETVDVKIATIYYPANKNGEPILIKKTFASEPRTTEFDPPQLCQEIYSKSKLSVIDLESVQKQFGVKKIVENTFIVTVKNDLVGKSDTTLIDDYKGRSIIGKKETKEFNLKTVFDDTEDLENNLQMLSSHRVEEVVSGAKGFFEGISEIHNYYKKTLNVKSNLESDFHAFLYGCLSLNYKKRFHFDAFVERVSGRGYADLLVLSTKSDNWKSIPIIVELKTGIVSPTAATTQIINKGYMYNLSLKTLSDDVVLVGVNPNCAPSCVSVTTGRISRPDFMNALYNNIDNIRKLKQTLPQELLDMHLSIATRAERNTKRLESDFSEGDRPYLGHMILGQLLSKKGSKVFVKGESDRIQTLFFKIDGKSGSQGKWTMLNMHLDDELKTDPSIIGRPEGINNFLQIDVSLIFKPAKRIPIEISESINDKTVSVNDAYKTVNSKINIDDFFNGPDSITTALGELGSELKSLKDIFRQFDERSPHTYITKESHFQAILHGLFLGHHKTVNADGSTTLIRVFPEANLSNAGFADFIIQKMTVRSGVVEEHELIVMELKISNSPTGAPTKVREAKDQLKKYVGNQLKFITNLDQVTTVAACYETSMSKIYVDSETVPIASARSSQDLYDTMNPSGSDVRPVKKARRGRSVNEKPFINGINETVHFIGNTPYTQSDSISALPEEYISVPESSGASRAEFWPLKFANRLQSAFSSIKGALLEPFRSSINNNNDGIFQDQQGYTSSLYTTDLLNFGDKFLKNTDVNGLLLWGYYFLKRRGNKSKIPSKNKVDVKFADGIVEGLLASEIVEEIFSYIEESSERLELPYGTRKYWDNSEIYHEAIRIAQRKIYRREFASIYKDLGKLLCQRTKEPNINNLFHMLCGECPLLEAKIDIPTGK